MREKEVDLDECEVKHTSEDPQEKLLPLVQVLLPLFIIFPLQFIRSNPMIKLGGIKQNFREGRSNLLIVIYLYINFFLLIISPKDLFGALNYFFRSANYNEA